jgi:hypothetical protein
MQDEDWRTCIKLKKLFDIQWDQPISKHAQAVQVYEVLMN